MVLGVPRVAVVTGAARGIGAATVATLAADEWCVLAVDRAADDPALPYRLGTQEQLNSVVAACNAPDRVAPFTADVRDPEALHAAVAEAEQRWGGLDAALAVAGVIAGGTSLWELDRCQEQAVLDVNLVGVLNLARAAVPALLRRPKPRTGRFLAVASAAATRGLPMLAAYCAAKAGVAGLIRALAVELGAEGVTSGVAGVDQGVRLVDEQHAAQRRVDHLVGLERRRAEVFPHQVRALRLDHLGPRQQPQGGEDPSEHAGDRRLAPAR